MQQPRVDRPQAPEGYGISNGSGPRLSWEFVEGRLRESRNYWLATTRPNGRPHVTPVWGVWVEGALYVSGIPTTRWARNLAANPTIAVHLESGDDVVIVEGTAADTVTDAALSERIVAAWNAKYGQFAPEPATDGIMQVLPRTARAWTDTDEALADATRFTWKEPPES